VKGKVAPKNGNGNGKAKPVSKKNEDESDEEKPQVKKGSKSPKKAPKGKPMSDSESEKSSEEEVKVPSKKTNGKTEDEEKGTGEEDDGETHSELFVKNLPWSVTEDSLTEYFSQFGTVATVKVLRKDGRPSGIGFVNFETRAEAKKAMQNVGEFEGRQIGCDFSNNKKEGGRTNDFQPRGNFGNAGNDRSSGSNFTIFVGNLGFKTNEVAIKKFFSKAGNVVGVRIAKHEDGKAKGFCHVDFDSQEGVTAAIQLAGQMLDDRELRVDASEPRKNREGGFGGGFGGRGGRGGFGGRGGDRGGRGGRGGFNKPNHGRMGESGKKTTFEDDD